VPAVAVYLKLQRKPNSVTLQDEAVWDTMKLTASAVLNVVILEISYVGIRKKSTSMPSKLIDKNTI